MCCVHKGFSEKGLFDSQHSIALQREIRFYELWPLRHTKEFSVLADKHYCFSMVLLSLMCRCFRRVWRVLLMTNALHPKNTVGKNRN